MIARYATAIVTGTVVTFLLLWLMQVLIAVGKEAIVDEQNLKFVDFVRVDREEITETKKLKPKKPPEPEQPPPDMPPPSVDDLNTNPNAIRIGAVNPNVDINVGGIGGFDMVDGEYLPIVKVAPIYPRRAQSRGLEGYCILEFVVTRQGTVRDVTTVECSSTLFERASTNAAYKFKYKPRVVNGEAIEVPGVRNKITFQLED